MQKSAKGGFSFVQILIILTLVALLIAGVIFIIKPSKVLEKSRDSQRFSDMKNLSTAINQYLADSHDFKGLVGPYSSIDTGFKDDSVRQKIDGTGWVPINFKLISTGAPFDTLPLDPLNSAIYNYRLGVSVSSKTYEIDCVFESPENISRHSTDGGNNPNAYELGTDLTIL
ncbi:MAG: hypothetical protein M1429_02910 [Patescibacteria group bacterium]|nr:hypothetical protein [Patescibacteria group bacterium]